VRKTIKTQHLFLCLTLLSAIGEATDVYISVDSIGMSGLQGSIDIYHTNSMTISSFASMPAGVTAGAIAIIDTTGCISDGALIPTGLANPDIYAFHPQNVGVSPALLTSTEPGSQILSLALSSDTVGYLTYLITTGMTTSGVVYQFNPISMASPTPLFELPPDFVSPSIVVSGTTGYVLELLIGTGPGSIVYTFDLTSLTPTLSPLTTSTAPALSMGVSGTVGCLLSSSFFGFGANEIYTFDPILGGTPTLLTSFSGSIITTAMALSDPTTGYITGIDMTGAGVLFQFNPRSSAAPVLIASLPDEFPLALAIASSPSPPPSPVQRGHSYAPRLAYPLDTAFEAQLDVIKGLAGHLSEQRLQRSFVALPEQMSAALGDTVDYCNCQPKKTFSLWMEGLAAYFRQNQKHQDTPFSSVLGGAILGLDYEGYLEAPLGGGIAVTHGAVEDKDGLGHASVNQEYAFLYESFVLSSFYADVALWGSYAQIRNVRNIGDATLTSHTTAWLLTPHLELGGDLPLSLWTIESFVMLDLPNSWELGFQEYGSASQNLKQKKQHASLLRTEVGLRFYEGIECEWGLLVLLEKASYVNKKPFHVGAVTTSFLTGAPGLFTVDTLTSTQNLGVAELAILFEPKKKRNPYVSFSYQGEFGSTFQSHQGMLIIGRNW
jgi:hypothetical protein